MTGKWKKAAAVLLAAVMAVLLVPLPTYAKETAKISVGSGSCDIGDEVTISVSVSSSVDIYMCDIWLSYDSGVLQPVSGYSGGGGVSVSLLSTDSTSFSVLFKAVSAGSSSISVSTSNTIISSADEDYMAVSAGSGSVTVKAPVSYSTDNTLASLDISPGVLSPAFSPNVTSYTTTVGSDCSQLVVSAVANDENASVSVRGPRMDPGSNTTTITVTPQDGTKKVNTPRNFHFFLIASYAYIALFPVFRPIAISVVSRVNPTVSTSTRYRIRKSPPPSFAARYGNLHRFPTPTALPAAAKTNPICPLNPFFCFISIPLSCFFPSIIRVFIRECRHFR